MSIPQVSLPEWKRGGWIGCAAVSPDGRRLAIAYRNDANQSALTLLQVEAGETVKLSTLADVESPHPGCVSALQFSPDSQTLATGSEDGTIKLWDATKPPPAAWRPRWTLTASVGTIWAVGFRGDGKVLAFGTWPKPQPSAGLVDVQTGKVIRTYPTTLDVNAVAFSPNRLTLAIGCFDGTVQLWDASGLSVDANE